MSTDVVECSICGRRFQLLDDKRNIGWITETAKLDPNGELEEFIAPTCDDCLHDIFDE